MKSEDHSPKSSKQQRSIRQRVFRACGIYVVVPYLAVTVIIAGLQRRLIYKPTVADSLALSTVGLDHEFGRDVELITTDGNTIRGWLVYGSEEHRSGDGVRSLVLYFPGNSRNRRERVSDLREFASGGFDVLIFDYRGFGDSTGSPDESSLSDDALLVWKYAHEHLGYDEGRIIVYGESLGGAVALSMWSGTNPQLPQPAALILNSTFASMPQTVRWHYPLFPFHILLFDRWPSIERIDRVQTPIIVFHGTDDQIVPVAHGRYLAQASPHARFIEIGGATHNEIPMPPLRKELDSLMAGLHASNSE